MKVKDTQKTIRILYLVLIDVILINYMNLLSLMMRFDFRFSQVPRQYLVNLGRDALLETVVILGVFAIMRIYQSLWQFAGTQELLKIVWAVLVGKWLSTMIELLIGNRMPVSYYVFSTILVAASIGGVRFSYRMIRIYRIYSKTRGEKGTPRNVMLIGAGAAGSIILREIKASSEVHGIVRCVIDDDPRKQQQFFHGVKVVGGREMIEEAAKAYEINEIIIAIPSMSGQDRKEIINRCSRTGCKLRTLPAIFQMVNGDVSVSRLRSVEIEDLLEREPVDIRSEQVSGYVKDKVVLVTGGGGSIGSELCRQIACNHPRQLIIFDIYENNAYDIQNELREKHPELNLVVLIGSVRNTNRVESVFAKYHPEIVYHAAAHKHVPLMEDSPNEAVKNNVLGTLKTAEMADRYGTKKFVLISTDKAVNPTNIMGASKRICEMIVQQMNLHSKTNYVAVRFGNVLGSNGSVIPLFKKQIENGGPITITHPDIIRYFMTIPEAVSLVLQAGANAKGGEIFVLDMGKPVKIMDLAINLIRLSGLTPYEDIDIQFVGLRPGEKLYEEMLMAEEGLAETANQKIKIGKPIPIDRQKFWHDLRELEKAAISEQPIHGLMKRLVPEYVLPANYQESADTASLDGSAQEAAAAAAEPLQSDAPSNSHLNSEHGPTAVETAMIWAESAISRDASEY